MIYKLLIIKNRYTKPLDFKKYLDWFKANTPLEVVIVDTISTDFELTTMPVGQTGAQGVVPGLDILDKLRTVVLPGKYHAVVLVAGNKLDGVRVSIAYNIPLFPGTNLVYMCFLSDKGKSLNHELFHTFFQRLWYQGIQLEDPLDMVFFSGQWRPYYNNSSPDAVPSNRSIAKERLAPYWDKVASLAPVPVPNPVWPYKWFSPAEVARWKMKPEVWQLLDECRERSKTPYIITSGLRTPQENTAVGGKPNSAHLRGLAVDLLCLDNFKRTLMLRGIINSTKPLFLEIAKKHLHIDLDSSIHVLNQTIVESDD